MKKNCIVTAIDVGTTKVCTVMANIDNSGNMRIIGVGNTPSSGMQKGMVVNIKEAGEAIRSSIRRAELASGHKIAVAILSEPRVEVLDAVEN